MTCPESSMICRCGEYAIEVSASGFESGADATRVYSPGASWAF